MVGRVGVGEKVKNGPNVSELRSRILSTFGMPLLMLRSLLFL